MSSINTIFIVAMIITGALIGFSVLVEKNYSQAGLLVYVAAALYVLWGSIP